MTDWRDPREVIEAAEQAAAAGDYASAEQLLREAAELQESALGPTHPDLANTLNNLGVVCEITDKPVEAEAFFRRAYAIATAVLEPNHPFVLTSRKNLEDFCSARGKAFDVTGIDEVSLEQPAEESRPVESRAWSHPLAVGAVIAVGVVLGFIAIAAWVRWNDSVKVPTETSRESSKSLPPSSKSERVKSVAPDAPKVSKSKTGVKTSRPPDEPRVSETLAPPAASAKGPASTAKSSNTTPKSVGTTSSVPQPLVVAAAELCGTLSTRDWRCVSPRQPVGSGSIVFYTRLKSPTVTAVQHRWYRGDRLHRVVNLPVRVNTTDGYRTYSRTTVDTKGGSDWRVELRTKDGAVLHEERFVVR